MKTVDSMSCWLALLYIIVSLFGLYPPITELPIGGSFDLHILQKLANLGNHCFQLKEPLRYNRFEWGRRFVPNASLSLVPSLSPSSNLSENPNGNPVLSLDPSFNPWNLSSSMQLPQDDDNKEEDDDGDDDDNDNNNDDLIDVNDDNDDNNLINVDNDDNLMCLQNSYLNVVEGMSEYEVLRLQRLRRNEVKLASLGLLTPMTSATSLSSDCSNSKKCSVPQDDVERRVQLTRNAKKTTPYRDLDDPVIDKRTRSIDSSDTREEDTDSKRMDEAEYSPSGGDDEEDDDEDELESYDDDDNDDDDELDRRSDLLHLIVDVGHHCEVNCTVRFSNSNSSGPEVFEATVNNDDLKPPVRCTVLPTPPMQVKRDTRMGSGLCRLRQGRQQVKRDPPNGRRGTLSSYYTTECQR